MELKLTTEQRRTLRTAFKNHEYERRRLPVWRAGIVAHIPTDAQELGGPGRGATAFPFNPSLAGRSRGDGIGQTRDALNSWSKQHLPPGSGGQASRAHHPLDLERSGIIPEFLPAQTDRLEAVKLRDKWALAGLNVGLFSDLQDGADLYEYEILTRCGWTESVSLARLEYPGKPQRLPAPIEIVLPKPQRPKAKAFLNELLNPLEDEGLIVRVCGTHVAWTWHGIQLTARGVELCERLRDEAAAGPPDEAVPEAPWIAIRCPSCTGTSLEFDPSADPEKPVNGAMFRFDAKYGLGGLNWTPPFFFSDDSGPDMITCPLCDIQLTTGDGILKDGCLPSVREEAEGDMGTTDATNATDIPLDGGQEAEGGQTNGGDEAR